MPVTKEPIFASIIYDLFKTMQIVMNESDDFLANLPESEDSHILCVVKVINLLCLNSIHDWSILLCVYYFWMAQLSIQCRACDHTTFSYAEYAILMISILRNVKSGCKFEHLAKVLINTRNDKEMVLRFHLTIYRFPNNRRDPLYMNLEPLLNAYQIDRWVVHIEQYDYVANNH